MFIPFIPSSIRPNGHAKKGVGGMKESPRYPVISWHLTSGSPASKADPIILLYCSNDYWRLFRGLRGLWNLLTGNWRLCLPL